MTRSLSARASVQFCALAVAAAVALICVTVWLFQGGDGQSQAAEPLSVTEWQTIEHRGVRVDIPAHWQKQDSSKCDLDTARWGEPDAPPCLLKNGITFYESAVFDPAHSPGVLKSTEDGSVRWSGYTYAGRFAVYVFDNDDRELVRSIMSSARETT